MAVSWAGEGNGGGGWCGGHEVTGVDMGKEAKLVSGMPVGQCRDEIYEAIIIIIIIAK